MNDDPSILTFRMLLARDGRSSFGRPEDPHNYLGLLPEEFDSVRDVPLAKLDDYFLYLALSQNVYVEHVAPITVHRVFDDPIAGWGYDGQLFSHLCVMTVSFWRHHPDLGTSVLHAFSRLDRAELQAETFRDIELAIRNIQESRQPTNLSDPWGIWDADA